MPNSSNCWIPFENGRVNDSCPAISTQIVECIYEMYSVGEWIEWSGLCRLRCLSKIFTTELNGSALWSFTQHSHLHLDVWGTAWAIFMQCTSAVHARIDRQRERERQTLTLTHDYGFHLDVILFVLLYACGVCFRFACFIFIFFRFHK